MFVENISPLANIQDILETSMLAYVYISNGDTRHMTLKIMDS